MDNREKDTGIGQAKQNTLVGKILGASSKETDIKNLGVIKSKDHILVEKPEQLNFLMKKYLLERQNRNIELLDRYSILIGLLSIEIRC